MSIIPTPNFFIDKIPPETKNKNNREYGGNIRSNSENNKCECEIKRKRHTIRVLDAFL